MPHRPNWLREWMSSLTQGNGVTAEINMDAFKARRSEPLRGRLKGDWSDCVLETCPPVFAEVGTRLRSSNLHGAFRLDFYRSAPDGENQPFRSFACGWRCRTGTFVVTRCAAGATEASDEQHWSVEFPVNGSEARVLHSGFYSHLAKNGRAVQLDECAMIRQILRTLRALDTPLAPSKATDDPRWRPVIFGKEPNQWFANLARVVAARVVIAGLLNSKNWKPHARAFFAWDEKTLEDFSNAWGWRATSGVKQLERDLVKRFTEHLNDRAARDGTDTPILEELNSSEENEPQFDGQKPDACYRTGDHALLVIEAKLGLTRHSVRTGLAQACEYLFHARRAGRWQRIDAVLLLEEPPSQFGTAFAEFARDTANQLGIGVTVETPSQGFETWLSPRVDTAEVSGDLYSTRTWNAVPTN